VYTAAGPMMTGPD